jgi:hypothetical protein
MTVRFFMRGLVLVAAACSGFVNPTQAQPSAAVAVSPPARSDVALQGHAFAWPGARDHLACQAVCASTTGCAGYNFDKNAKSACTLLSGTLVDVAVRGAVSCRMPCTASPKSTSAKSAPPAPPAAILRAPVVPAPSPPPPPAALPALPTRQALKPVPPARTGVVGWELVTGADVQIAPLSSGTAVAQCPNGKVALNAAYEFTPLGAGNADAAFGLEIRGAIPDGALARVFGRNANVFVAAQLRATAVCVNPPAGFRTIDVSKQQTENSLGLGQYTTCGPNERLIGGGVMGSIDVVVDGNGPAQGRFSTGQLTGSGPVVVSWHASGSTASSLASGQTAYATALCALEQAVDGWEYVAAPDASLGGRSRTSVPIRCSPGHSMLAVGFSSSSSADNFISPVLQIAGNDATAQLLNRNVIGGAGSLVSRLGALCARRQ